MTRKVALFVALVSVGVLSGCGGLKFMRPARPGEELKSPPSGMALVNFLRPTGWGGGDLFEVFEGEKLIGTTKGKTRFQVVCSPGEHVFHAKAEKVTVVQAQLLADKIYDVVVDVAMGMWRANIKLAPITKAEPRRNEVAEWEARSSLYVLDPTQNIEAFESKRRADNQEILKDFLSGEKQDRVQKLGPDDHR